MNFSIYSISHNLTHSWFRPQFNKVRSANKGIWNGYQQANAIHMKVSRYSSLMDNATHPDRYSSYSLSFTNDRRITNRTVIDNETPALVYTFERRYRSLRIPSVYQTGMKYLPGWEWALWICSISGRIEQRHLVTNQVVRRAQKCRDLFLATSWTTNWKKTLRIKT